MSSASSLASSLVSADVVGTLAALLTTSAFFPQAIKTLRSGETAGLSLVMYVMLVAGVGLWLAYGIMIASRPLIVANAIVIVPQLAILALLVRQHVRRPALPIPAPTPVV